MLKFEPTTSALLPLILSVIGDLISDKLTDISTVTSDDVETSILVALETDVLPVLLRHVRVRLSAIGVVVVEAEGDVPC